MVLAKVDFLYFPCHPASTAGPVQGCGWRSGLCVSALCRGARSRAPGGWLGDEALASHTDCHLCGTWTPLFFWMERMEGGLFSVNWKGVLERCHQIQHHSSQYAAFRSQEILCLGEGDREVKSRRQRKKWGEGTPRNWSFNRRLGPWRPLCSQSQKPNANTLYRPLLKVTKDQCDFNYYVRGKEALSCFLCFVGLLGTLTF